jgi:AcrR family transcriptional regulator
MQVMDAVARDTRGATEAETCHVDPRVERTRAAILDAARELLMSEGPDAVTHAQVAANANVSRTTVYKHHPDRGALILATIEQVGRPFPEDLTGDFRTDLLAFLDDLVNDLSNDQHTKAFATLIERAQHDPEIAGVRDQIMCDGIDHFQMMMKRAIERGDLRDDIDLELAMSGLLGTFFFRRFMANQPVDHALAERVVDHFITTYSPR